MPVFVYVEQQRGGNRHLIGFLLLRSFIATNILRNLGRVFSNKKREEGGGGVTASLATIISKYMSRPHLDKDEIGHGFGGRLCTSAACYP